MLALTLVLKSGATVPSYHMFHMPGSHSQVKSTLKRAYVLSTYGFSLSLNGTV